MAVKKSYDNTSITALEGADRVRKRPGVIFGSDGLEGCQHSMFEILSNSIDEARTGHGKKIIITRFLDNSIEVEDFGRGVPVDYNPVQKKFNYELVYCEMYAGGKYSNEEDSNYNYSLGLNGLGACATQYASEYMDVTVYRDETKYDLHFEKGNIVGELKKEPYKGKRTGTITKWKPDLEVFTEIEIDKEYFIEVIKRQAIVNDGVEFVFRNQIDKGFEEEVFSFNEGIVDYLKELNADTGLTEIQVWKAEKMARDRADKNEYKVLYNIAMCFSNKNKLSEYYHNSSWLEYGGVPQKAVRNAFVAQIDSYLKKSNKYNKNESKITFGDVEDCLMIVISSFSNVTSYENQTKKSITNKGIQDTLTEYLKHQLEVYFIENPLDAEKACNQVLINKRSRENADKLRQNMKKNLTATMDLTNRVAKFVDCRTKDKSIRELFIVEGDSALGACKQARNSEFQAVIPIRGKILNCLKADLDKIFKNEIITDLLKVMGCGVEVKTKANKDLSTFELDNLRWNKIILCTDADVDGFHIRTLLLTMIQRLTPTLIEEGFVYIAESPLYEITAKDETYFAYTEGEKEKYLAQLEGKKYTIQRSKGLGENEPDMMSLTTMNPSTRRLIKVCPTDIAETEEMFSLLLGDNLNGRKDYIANNGHNYISMIDVS